MRVMTSAMAQVWVNYLVRELNMAGSLEELEPLLRHAEDEIEQLAKYGLIDCDEANDSYQLLKQAHADAVKRVDLLNRAKTFASEENPRVCFHKHKRCKTGVFFNSIGILKCLECGNWQDIREVIQ